MSKIFLRINPESTYCIVDTPLFCSLQWLYLSSIYGESRLNLISNSKHRIKPKKINIVPVGLASQIPQRADLFVSTWGLSESSQKCVDLVISKNWFSARHILLALQKGGEKFPAADKLNKEAQRRGAKHEDVLFPSGSKYLFL